MIKAYRLLGDTLEISRNGDQWIALHNMQQHTTEGAAMRAELTAYYAASGDDVDDPATVQAIEDHVAKFINDGAERMTGTKEIYELTLAPEYYETRETASGKTVRDVVPWQGATAYVSDGERWGFRYESGDINWLDVAANLPSSVELVDVGQRGHGAVPQYLDLLEETLTGVPWELYIVKEYDATYVLARSGNRKELLWLPNERRAGICYGSESAWTDATSPEQAIWRYLLGEMVA